ncbi:MAG: bifunctional precorrin-2 dehydrogenase/sirohydrochlorin ferrochelatase [Chitinophagales bacterium]
MTVMFPVIMDLKERRCLIIGGGEVALRKVHNLLDCGAEITVITPSPGQDLYRLAEERRLVLIERVFQDDDILGSCLVFAATNNKDVNERIHELAVKMNIPVNVVDDPENCSFFVPSTLRRGHLLISVSTEGYSPLLARKIRENLETVFGSEYEDYIELLGDSRELVKKLFNREEDRRMVFGAIIDLDLLPLVQSGRKQEAKERILQCIYSLRG